MRTVVVDDQIAALGLLLLARHLAAPSEPAHVARRAQAIAADAVEQAGVAEGAEYEAGAIELERSLRADPIGSAQVLLGGRDDILDALLGAGRHGRWRARRGCGDGQGDAGQHRATEQQSEQRAPGTAAPSPG